MTRTRPKRSCADLSSLREQVATWDKLEQDVADAEMLLAMAVEAEDESVMAEVAAETEALTKRYEDLEFQLALSGRYDNSGAILSVHAGVGGTEAQDWAQMLMRMYLRWAERRDYDIEITNQLEGEEAGIKTVTIEVTGPWAYGYLKSERGVHRLVRISPFDSSARRHTSFALVEVVPDPGRADRYRDQSQRPQDRRLSVGRRGRPERPEKLDRHPADPYPNGHRGDVPERAQPASES